MQLIKSALGSYTVRQSTITVIAVTSASALGAIFYTILARLLGPAEYGLFSISMSVLLVGVSITDFGITQGLVKFVASKQSNRGYYPFLKLSVVIKVVAGIIFGLGITLFSGLLAERVIHQPIGHLLPIVGLGVFAQSIFSLELSLFQGLQSFIRWGILVVGVNLIRIALLLALWLINWLTSVSALFISSIIYLIGLAFTARWIDWGWLKSKPTAVHSAEFWNFNKWAALVGILAAVLGKVDILIAGRYLSLTEVGTYSLSTIMVSFLPQLVSAIGAVTTAKFAALKHKKDESSYLLKSLLFVAGVGIAVALAMIPMALIVISFTGKAYQPSFAPFLILLVSQIVFICANPFRDSVMYFHSRPKIFVILNALHVITLGVVGLILVRSFGVMGLAMAVLTGQFVSAVGAIIYYRRLSGQNS